AKVAAIFPLISLKGRLTTDAKGTLDQCAGSGLRIFRLPFLPIRPFRADADKRLLNNAIGSSVSVGPPPAFEAQARAQSVAAWRLELQQRRRLALILGGPHDLGDQRYKLLASVRFESPSFPFRASRI